MVVDDGFWGIFVSGMEGSFVVDIEIDYLGIVKIYFFDFFKVSMFLFVKVLLSFCGGSWWNYINEFVGVFINFVYVFFICFRGDKYDYFYVILFCNGVEVFLIVFERKVGNDDFVNVVFGVLLVEVVKVELYDWVEIFY